MFQEFIGSVKSVGRYIAQNPIKSAALGALAITGIGAAAYAGGLVGGGAAAAGLAKLPGASASVANKLQPLTGAQVGRMGLDTYFGNVGPKGLPILG